MNYTISNGLTCINGSNPKKIGPYYTSKKFKPSEDLTDKSKISEDIINFSGNTRDNDLKLVSQKEVLLPKNNSRRLHSKESGSNRNASDKVLEEQQKIAEEERNPNHRSFD